MDIDTAQNEAIVNGNLFVLTLCKIVYLIFLQSVIRPQSVEYIMAKKISSQSTAARSTITEIENDILYMGALI
jgi:hypothetical protein